MSKDNPCRDCGCRDEDGFTNLEAALLLIAKRGDCYCEVGIDNPNMGGIHSNQCVLIRKMLHIKEIQDAD